MKTFVDNYRFVKMVEGESTRFWTLGVVADKIEK